MRRFLLEGTATYVAVSAPAAACDKTPVNVDSSPAYEAPKVMVAATESRQFPLVPLILTGIAAFYAFISMFAGFISFVTYGSFAEFIRSSCYTVLPMVAAILYTPFDKQ